MMNHQCNLLALIAPLILSSCLTYEPETESTNSRIARIVADSDSQQQREFQAEFDSYPQVSTTFGSPTNITNFINNNRKKVFYWDINAKRYTFTNEGWKWMPNDPLSFPDPCEIIGYNNIFPIRSINKEKSNYIIDVDISFSSKINKWAYFHEDYYTYKYVIIRRSDGIAVASNTRTWAIVNYEHQNKIFKDQWE